MLLLDNNLFFGYIRMANEANRDLLWILGSLTLINLSLTIYSLKVARTLSGDRTQYSTVTGVAHIDNRKNSCVSMARLPKIGQTDVPH